MQEDHYLVPAQLAGFEKNIEYNINVHNYPKLFCLNSCHTFG